MTVSKNRNFAFILYPESLSEDWLIRLEILGIPMAISPLHDRDKMEKKTDNAIRKQAEYLTNKYIKEQIFFDDVARKNKYDEMKKYYLDEITKQQKNLPEYKKAHYHVLYVNHNPVTSDSVLKKLRRKLGNNAVGHVEIVDNVENYHLYLTHESADAKAHNKHVYASKDIKYLNGFDISRYITMDKEQKQDLFVSLIQIVKDKHLINMIQLMNYIEKHGKEIGIDSLAQLIKVTDSNAWFLKMVFDGNYQEKMRNTPK